MQASWQPTAPTQYRICIPMQWLDSMWLTSTKYRIASSNLIFLYFSIIKVSSSAEMEPYSCKTLLLNLACEHGLKINSFTTDRSSSVKTVLRFNSVFALNVNWMWIYFPLVNCQKNCHQTIQSSHIFMMCGILSK